MPGPGGGSRGGGFGGGSRGGGFGGGMGRGPGGFGHGPRGPRRHFYGPMFWGFGPRRYYYGGGLFGGLLGMLMFPIIMIIIVAVMLFGHFAGSVARLSNGGEVRYNEAAFQEYANTQYAAEFGGSTAYEDNLLIIFLTNEKADGYYAIAWIGNNINTRINEMFGNEYTEFGRAMQSSINSQYYAYSLSSNLALAMDKMTERVDALGLESSFRRKTDHSNMTASHVTNHSSLQLDEETVELSLTAFTEATDIPVVIVVDSMEEVFGKSLSASDIMILIVGGVIIVTAIVMIVKSVKNRKKSASNSSDQNQGQGQNGNGGYYNSYNEND